MSVIQTATVNHSDFDSDFLFEMYMFVHQNQNCHWSKRQSLVPSPYRRSELSNRVFCTFSSKKERTLSEFKSLIVCGKRKIEKGLQFNRLISIDLLIDRCMTSEGSDTLILPFTSKTGQSVAQNRQKIFIWVFVASK